MTTKTAHDGDCLCNMAVDAGFYNCQPLRDEPKNSAYLTRPLKEGDEVTIPDVRPRIESGNTDLVHKFVLKTAPPVKIRYVHGSPDKHYLDDDTVPPSGAGFNISTFVTNLGGANERSPFPSQFEFHQEGHVDPATFKVEVVDPAAGSSLNVVLEAMKPIYKSDGSVDHYDTFAGAPNAAQRKIDKLNCAKVKSAVAYRSKYLRLVVDELDKKTVSEQTLLVTDTADGQNGDNDKLEILDQAVKATYTITRCAGTAPNQCAVTTQATVGNDRKRARLTVHIFKSPQITVQEPDVRQRVNKWFRRVYAQANVSPKLTAVDTLDPPANNMLVISQNSGNSSSGTNASGSTSTLSFDLFTASPGSPPNFASDGSVNINLSASQKPTDVGNAVKGALPQGYKADVILNPTAFGSFQGSCDVLITKDGKTVDIRNEVTDDTLATVTVARVDLNRVVIAEGSGHANEELTLNGAISATPEQRRVIRSAPGDGTQLNVFVVGFMAPRDRTSVDRTTSTRGTTIGPATDLDSDLQPGTALARSILVAAFTMVSGDDEPFVLPHEAGHALMDAFHANDPNAFLSTDPVIKSQLMFLLPSAKNALVPSDRFLKTLADVTKRLSNTRLAAKDSSEESMTVPQDAYDSANPRSRGGKSFPTNEVQRLRDKGSDVMEDWGP